MSCSCPRCRNQVYSKSVHSVSESESLLVTNVPIDKKNPCVNHCYNFRCFDNKKITDDCGDVDGTIHGNVCLKSEDGPNLGNYLFFEDGDQKMITLDQNININSNGFAVSLWFKTPDLTQDARFLSKAINNFVQGHIASFQIFEDTLKIRLKLGNDIADGTVEVATGSILSANTWYHAVYWFDGCNIKIYLDGVEQVLIPNLAGTGENKRADFNTLKGVKVFQGDQSVGVGSQPVNPTQTFPGWRSFNGCIDQLIIWNHPISLNAITTLHNGGQGSNSVPKELSVHSAKLDKCNHLLTFSHILCLKTCFNLCCALKGCETLTLEAVDPCGEKNKTILVDKINSLSAWPGDLDVLERTENGDCVNYTIRLSLDIHKVYSNINKKCIRLSVHNASDIILPLSPFSITGSY